MQRNSLATQRFVHFHFKSMLCGPFLAVLVLGATPAIGEEPSGDTTVFHASGKSRVHVKDCPRYKRLSDKEKAAMKTMTYAEAKEKGLPLCSRCPGSTTPGKGNSGEAKSKASGLPESWVKPAPGVISKRPFVPSKFAPLVSMGSDGKLVYKPYTDKGDKLLDWSSCGYKRSEEPIPNVKVVETLAAPSGEARKTGNMAYPQGPDSRGMIQAALDKVAAMPPGADGFKGAVLLKKGTYYVNGALTVGAGVVLRGEGDGENGTVIIARRVDGEKEAIRVGSPDWEMDHSGAEESVRITDAYVASGSDKLTLANASSFKAGDYVIVRKTTNQQWIDDLGMGERLRHIRGGKEGQHKKPWKPEAYQFRHLRQIAKVSGNTVTLNLILPQSIEDKHGGGDVYKVDLDDVPFNIGVESLRLISNYDTTVKDTGKDADFKNFRSGIVVFACGDAWIRNCTVLHVSFACALIRDNTQFVTVRDSKNLKPVGPKRGGNRYAFAVAGGTGHLFYNCFSEDGRHDFAGGSRDTGPFAFVKCTAVRGGQSEPHHRWGTGFLYDHVTTKDGVLAAINRGDSGTGHGWSAANTLIWNGDAKNVVVFDPETTGENNFAIGYRGEILNEYDTTGLMYANNRAGYWGTPQEGGYFGYALMGSGHIESPDKPVEPASLFTQQLIDRIGKDKAMAILK